MLRHNVIGVLVDVWQQCQTHVLEVPHLHIKQVRVLRGFYVIEPVFPENVSKAEIFHIQRYVLVSLHTTGNGLEFKGRHGI